MLYERRLQLRRKIDYAIQDLYQTFSTSHCHECLQKWNDGALLLDNNKNIVFITQAAEKIIIQNPSQFQCGSKFVLLKPGLQMQLEGFLANVSGQSIPLTIMFDADNKEKIALSANSLPLPAIPNLNSARFLVKLRYFSRTDNLKWQIFARHYRLTVAELRLCRNLARGLSLKEYSLHWKITVGTARSQLHSVLKKTGTRRQSDLMRLIFSQA